MFAVTNMASFAVEVGDSELNDGLTAFLEGGNMLPQRETDIEVSSGTMRRRGSRGSTLVR